MSLDNDFFDDSEYDEQYSFDDEYDDFEDDYDIDEPFDDVEPEDGYRNIYDNNGEELIDEEDDFFDEDE